MVVANKVQKQVGILYYASIHANPAVTPLAYCRSVAEDALRQYAWHDGSCLELCLPDRENSGQVRKTATLGQFL